MDAGWTWLLIQAASTPHSSCPELQRWTNQLPEQSEFVPVIKLNVIRLYTHCGGLLTEEDWQEMFREKRSKSWTLLLWTNWSACRTSPTPPLIGLLCCLCSLCVTQTINSQSQWSGVLPNEPRDTGSGGWMTPAEDRARPEAKEADGVSVKLQLIKRPIGGEVLCEREVQGEVVSLQSILNTVCQQIWACMWFYDNNVNLKGFECPLWCFHKDALSGTNIWHRFISCESGEPKMLGKVVTAAFLFCGQKWSTVTNSESYSNCQYCHQNLSCSCSFSAVKSICSLTDFFCFSFFCHTFMFQIIKPIWISDKDNLRKIQNEF